MWRGICPTMAKVSKIVSSVTETFTTASSGP